MKNYLIIALILTSGAYGTAATAEDKDSVKKEVQFHAKDDGGYESSAVTKTKTDQGTTEIVKTKENVDVQSDGKIVGTLKTDTRTNPKGLLNETRKSEEARNEINPDGTAKLTAKSEEVTQDGTGVDSKLKTVSKVAPDGSMRTTSNIKTTVDPKGMMNKSVLEIDRVTDTKPGGPSTTSVEKRSTAKL